MAKFRYIGDKPRGDCLGYSFPRMIATEVENPAHIRKLSGNPAFQRMDKAQTKAPAAPPVKTPKAPEQDQKPSDDNGEAGGDGDQGTDKVAGAE